MTPRIQTADITALIRERFQIKGAGSIDTLAPEIVAVLPVDPLLQFNALTPDVVESSVVVGAGSTTVNNVFTLERPALLTAMSVVTTTAAQPNVDWVRVHATDPAGAGIVVFYSAFGANALVLTASQAVFPNELQDPFPLFLPGSWELQVSARTNAGGAATVALDLLALIEQIR